MEIDRRQMEAALSTAIGAIGSKTSMPVLNNVLLDFDGQKVRIIATDLEVSVRTEIPARGLAKGRITAPGKKLLDISRTAAANLLELELQPNDRMTVRAGKGRFELPVISAEDFPLVDLQMGDAIKIDPFLVFQALQRIGHAIPSKSDTFTLPAAYMHLTDEQVRFASSDGHRLAYSSIGRVKLNGLDAALGVTGVNIPIDACVQIVRLLDGAEEAMVSLDIKEGGQVGKLKVSVGTTVLSCSLMDGEFPEYAAIVPAEPPYSILIQREDFLAALKRLKPFTDNVFIHVRMTMADNELRLQSGTEGTGCAEDALKVDYSGPEFSTAFKLDYVRDTLAAFSCDTVKFSWVDNFHGGVFTAPDREDFLCLIMPLVV